MAQHTTTTNDAPMSIPPGAGTMSKADIARAALRSLTTPDPSQSSFFTGAPLTDSPTSSPCLGAVPLGSPGPSEVPSLSICSSLSSASISDPLPSPGSSRDAAIQRVAAGLHLAVSDVWSAVHAHHGPGKGKGREHGLDNETLRLVLEAMRAEDERLAQVASFRTAYLRAESLRMEVELHQHRAEQQRRNSVMTGSPLAEPRSPPPPYLPPSFPSLPPLSSTNAYTRNADGERKRWPSGSDRFASPAFGQRRYRSTDDYAPANRPQHPHVSPLLDRERGTASPFAARGSIPGRVLYESPMASPRAFAPLPHHSPAASPSPHGMHVHSPSPSSSSSTNSRAGQKRRWTEGEVEEAARVKVEEMEVDTPSVQSTTSRASSCSISPLSHQEIMARLQLKVKSRLAAKERGELPSGPNAASTSGSSRSRAGKSSSSKSKAAGTDSSKTKAKDTPSRRTSLPVPAPSEPTPARAALGIDTLLCAAAVAEERALGLHQAHPHP